MLGFNIAKTKNSKNQRIIDYSSYRFIDGHVDDSIYLGYRDLMSTLLRDHADDIRFMMSATINRDEDTTRFFDNLIKYLCLLHIIRTGQENVFIKNLNYPVYRSLCRYMDSNGYRYRIRGMPLILIDIVIIMRFLIRLACGLFLEFFYLAVSKFFIRHEKRLNYDQSLFSFYDYRANENGEYKDPYFAAVHKYLLSRKQGVIVFTNLMPKIRPVNLIPYLKKAIRYIQEIAQFNKKCAITTVYTFILVSDILRAYWLGLRSKVKLQDKIIFQNEDITFLANMYLYEEYTRCYWKFPCLIALFFRRLFRNYNIGNIIYPYENHAWERMMIMWRNRLSPDTRLTGAQASSISLRFLNFFPGPDEVKLPIYPNAILTVGDIMKNLMNTYGHYPNGLIDVGCAMRAEHLFKPIRIRRRNGFSKKVAVAFPADTNDCFCIMEGLKAIFKGMDYLVYLKIHPLISQRQIARRGLPKNFLPAKNIPWDKIYADIDILFYEDNSVGAEALKYNITVAYLNLSGQVCNGDRLFQYDGNKVVLNSVHECRLFLKKYYERNPKEVWNNDRKVNEAYINKYFHPVTEEKIKKFCVW